MRRDLFGSLEFMLTQSLHALRSMVLLPLNRPAPLGMPVRVQNPRGTTTENNPDLSPIIYGNPLYDLADDTRLSEERPKLFEVISGFYAQLQREPIEITKWIQYASNRHAASFLDLIQTLNDKKTIPLETIMPVLDVMTQDPALANHFFELASKINRGNLYASLLTFNDMQEIIEINPFIKDNTHLDREIRIFNFASRQIKKNLLVEYIRLRFRDSGVEENALVLTLTMALRKVLNLRCDIGKIIGEEFKIRLQRIRAWINSDSLQNIINYIVRYPETNQDELITNLVNEPTWRTYLCRQYSTEIEDRVTQLLHTPPEGSDNNIIALLRQQIITQILKEKTLALLEKTSLKVESPCTSISPNQGDLTGDSEATAKNEPANSAEETNNVNEHEWDVNGLDWENASQDSLFQSDEPIENGDNETIKNEK